MGGTARSRQLSLICDRPAASVAIVRNNFRQFLALITASLLGGSPLLLRAAETNSADGLNLPARYRQLVADRAIIDRYQLAWHQVAAGAPEPVPVVPVPGAVGPSSRVVAAQLDPRTRTYRAQFPERFMPLRGFRAPILADATNEPLPVLFEERLTPAEREAADIIRRRLAFDGLLSTLAQVVHALGHESFLSGERKPDESLLTIGFPVDLLACFPLTENIGGTGTNLINHLVRRFAAGATLENVQADLRSVQFQVPADWTGFRIASETGGGPIEMVRMQFGGGYRNGIVPGDSLDVIGQMLRALPETEFVISVPDDLSRPFQTLVQQCWGLAESMRVTVIEEPFPIQAWAQDSGKAGSVTDPQTGLPRRATLVPRYASRDEGISSCLAGESFLMDGLAAAGERVRQFPLLFQGGNLLAMERPAGGRQLLVSESDVLRNLALGFTREQVLELFQRGFGVDRCVVLPAVSYHLDFDLSVRQVAGRPVALVNDPQAASRIIVRLGAEALRGEWLEDELARRVMDDLRSGSGQFARRELARVLELRRGPDGRFPGELAKKFVAGPVDSAAGNFQCFLQALDLLALDADMAGSGTTPERERFLAALRRIDEGRRAQIAELEALGLSVVAVPSMPNLLRSINYLNGLHHPGGLVLPVFGGFFAPLDRAAEEVLAGLAPGLKVQKVQCAELQRYFGGVHCAASVYPRPLP